MNSDCVTSVPTGTSAHDRVRLFSRQEPQDGGEPGFDPEQWEQEQTERWEQEDQDEPEGPEMSA